MGSRLVALSLIAGLTTGQMSYAEEHDASGSDGDAVVRSTPGPASSPDAPPPTDQDAAPPPPDGDAPADPGDPPAVGDAPVEGDGGEAPAEGNSAAAPVEGDGAAAAADDGAQVDGSDPAAVGPDDGDAAAGEDPLEQAPIMPILPIGDEVIVAAPEGPIDPELTKGPACSETTIWLRNGDGPEPIARFTVDVAADADSRAQGLMNVRDMPTGQGMLFVYPYPRAVSFWMKNTFIPLDIIFADQRGVVVKVHSNAKPEDETTIPGDGFVQYVLEINGGYAKSAGIGEGTQMRHPAIAASAWPCPQS